MTIHELTADAGWTIDAGPYQRTLTIDLTKGRAAIPENLDLVIDWRQVMGLKSVEEAFYPTKLHKLEHRMLRMGERVQAKEIDYVVSEEDDGFTIHFKQPGPGIQFSCPEGGYLKVQQVGKGSLQPFHMVLNFHLES